MADIQKRGTYVPRSQRQKRAYGAVKLGAISGPLFVVSVVLAAIGTISWIIPVVLAALTGLAWVRFKRATSR